LRLPGGTTITTAIVEGAQGASLALTPVALLRSREAGQPERVTVTAGVLNRTATAAADVPINLEIDGRVVQDLKIAGGAERIGVDFVCACHHYFAKHARDCPPWHRRWSGR
jgi:hypothetical protein